MMHHGSPDDSGKPTTRVPDFEIEDIWRRFALWLQKRCRENPRFESEIAEVTYSAPGTVKQWRSRPQLASFEAMLRAIAYGGPSAVDEVLLQPMGLTGARWQEEEALGR